MEVYKDGFVPAINIYELVPIFYTRGPVDGYARYSRPNWTTVGANLFHSGGNSLFVFVFLTPIYNCSV